jgi:hypothetical protein
MTATDLRQLTLKELKSIALENDIEVTGDRRAKLTFINAIEMWNQRSVATTAEAARFAFETPAFRSEVPDVSSVIDKGDDTTTLQQLTNETPVAQQLPMPQPTTQPPTPQHRGPSIVVLIPLILLTVAVILIKIGISVLIPLIGSLIKFMDSIWGFSNREDMPTNFVLISSAQS